ncbi:MAG: choice-of-anchor C family protein [Nitrosopumilus sp.]|uniref:choice-of-anchor C family protein n=1 Tax=Nitrosopumilus sp. TaxID=2024843 RepID=UPI00242C5AD0|nr:choice-of-anchor C family protein [Nitrosopumilus sp.]MCV0366220.1 choice-of-anchor C family protein [Nitrosopumilus sp.]
MKTILNTKHLAGILVLGAVMTLMMVSPSLATTNLVTNGSFEDPVDFCSGQPNPWHTLYTGDIQTGWTVGGHSIEVVCSAAWEISDGLQSVDLSGDAAGSVAQDITTSAGTTYDVTFDMAGNLACGDVVKSLTVSADGSSENFTFDTTGHSFASMGYEQKTFSFTATDALTTLTFTGNTAGPCGAVIDNIVLAEGTTEPEDGKVTICHKPDTPAEKTLRVPEAALKGHLKHGDTLGPCE